ncbi:hypothetical protein Scep_004298 [Stephania cephalantha]|uniref:Uncharacterized protein n=1 Tax=Stephania cephalantha TaxID=152367 RepID=A0AAP0KV26_9MAGN
MLLGDPSTQHFLCISSHTSPCHVQRTVGTAASPSRSSCPRWSSRYMRPHLQELRTNSCDFLTASSCHVASYCWLASSATCLSLLSATAMSAAPAYSTNHRVISGGTLQKTPNSHAMLLGARVKKETTKIVSLTSRD